MSKKLEKIIHLTKKVVEEVKQPSQLKDPQRRVDLYFKGKLTLKSIFIGTETQQSSLESMYERAVEYREINHGVTIATSLENPSFGMILFPQKTNLDLVYKEMGEYQVDCDYLISMPAYMLMNETGQLLTIYGIEAKNRSKSFKPFDEPEAQAHGGILFKEGQGLQFLNYHDMMSLYQEITDHTATNFDPENDSLLQTQWYIDSKNQTPILTTTSLKENPQPFNAFGQMTMRDGSTQIISINGSMNSYLPFFCNYFPITKEQIHLPTMEEITAFMNVLQRRYKAKSWLLVGIDYHGGGTLPTTQANEPKMKKFDLFQYTGRFRVHLPKD